VEAAVVFAPAESNKAAVFRVDWGMPGLFWKRRAALAGPPEAIFKECSVMEVVVRARASLLSVYAKP